MVGEGKRKAQGTRHKKYSRNKKEKKIEEFKIEGTSS